MFFAKFASNLLASLLEMGSSYMAAFFKRLKMQVVQIVRLSGSVMRLGLLGLPASQSSSVTTGHRRGLTGFFPQALECMS